MKTLCASHDHSPLPGESLSSSRMPGHWLLARLGKRVLRPGGVEATRAMLDALAIRSTDDVVEFAPGLGLTARMVLQCQPRSYTAVERDAAAADAMRHRFEGQSARCIRASADESGLPGQCASVVYGEAMLTMQASDQKRRIVAEAARLLRPGGRYGIHELALIPDDLGSDTRDAIERELAAAIHVQARPLTLSEWSSLLSGCGLVPAFHRMTPMRLLEPSRMIRDEGVLRMLRIAGNLIRDREARRRVFQMRRVFRKYHEHLTAIVLVAAK